MITIIDPDTKAPITHMVGGCNDYATPCGLALDGDEFSGRRVPTPKGAKIDCVNCKGLFKIIKCYERRDFK